MMFKKEQVSPPSDWDSSHPSLSTWTIPVQHNLKSSDIWGKARWLFPFQDSHNGNICCHITFHSISLIFLLCRKDFEWPGEVWTRPWRLQPEGRDQGLKVEQWSRLRRILLKVQFFLGVGPAFTSPTSRFYEGKTGFSPPFLPPSLGLKRQASFQLPWEPRAHFAQAQACHTSTCLPSHVNTCAASPRRGGWRLSLAFLSPSVQVLPRSFLCWLVSLPGFFLPCKHAGEAWQGPACV